MTYNGNTRACYMSAALGNWNPCLGKKGEAIKGKGNIDDRHPSGGIPLLCSFMGQSPVRTCSIGPTTSFLLSMKMEKQESRNAGSIKMRLVLRPRAGASP